MPIYLYMYVCVYYTYFSFTIFSYYKCIPIHTYILHTIINTPCARCKIKNIFNKKRGAVMPRDFILRIKTILYIFQTNNSFGFLKICMKSRSHLVGVYNINILYV